MLWTKGKGKEWGRGSSGNKNQVGLSMKWDQAPNNSNTHLPFYFTKMKKVLKFYSYIPNKRKTLTFVPWYHLVPGCHLSLVPTCTWYLFVHGPYLSLVPSCSWRLLVSSAILYLVSTYFFPHFVPGPTYPWSSWPRKSHVRQVSQF